MLDLTLKGIAGIIIVMLVYSLHVEKEKSFTYEHSYFSCMQTLNKKLHRKVKP